MTAQPIETPYPRQRHDDFDVDRRLYDALIVGGGPAGLSAAIYLARFNRSALVIDAGEGRSTSHETNENYLGFPEGIPSRDLRERGRRQAQRFGVDFADGCVLNVVRDGEQFEASADVCNIRARTLILATGAVDLFPEIDGLEECIGRSLFWCITCDGYKTRGKRVVVAGQTDEAAVTAMQLRNFTDAVTVVTNRRSGDAALSERVRANLGASCVALHEGVIASVEGEGGVLRSIALDDGTRIELDLLFSQQGSRPNNDLATALGVKTSEGGWIEVDEEQRTNVEHVYAAGDVTRIFAHQVVTAAHEGATAGQAANFDLYRPEQRG